MSKGNKRRTPRRNTKLQQHLIVWLWKFPWLTWLVDARTGARSSGLFVCFFWVRTEGLWVGWIPSLLCRFRGMASLPIWPGRLEYLWLIDYFFTPRTVTSAFILFSIWKLNDFSSHQILQCKQNISNIRFPDFVEDQVKWSGYCVSGWTEVCMDG